MRAVGSVGVGVAANGARSAVGTGGAVLARHALHTRITPIPRGVLVAGRAARARVVVAPMALVAVGTRRAGAGALRCASTCQIVWMVKKQSLFRCVHHGKRKKNAELEKALIVHRPDNHVSETTDFRLASMLVVIVKGTKRGPAHMLAHVCVVLRLWQCTNGRA